MNSRSTSLAILVSVLGIGSLAAQSPSPTTDAPVPSVADEATRDVAYNPAEAKATALLPAPTVDKLESAPVAEPDPEALYLSPYIVRDLPNRVYEQANEAMAQSRKLMTIHAVYHKDIMPPPARVEVLSAPEPGSYGKANFPLLRLSW